jgi:protein-S-isoprenylcysteine O-methyltransferase Ste14
MVSSAGRIVRVLLISFLLAKAFAELASWFVPHVDNIFISVTALALFVGMPVIAWAFVNLRTKTNAKKAKDRHNP